MLANLYMNLRSYEISLIYSKKLLKYAWIYNSKEFEMLAYEGISKTYYRMNLLDKAKYFFDRTSEY